MPLIQRPFDASAEFRVAVPFLRVGGDKLRRGTVIDKSKFSQTTLQGMYEQGAISVVPGSLPPEPHTGSVVADRLGMPVRRQTGTDKGKPVYALYLRGQQITQPTTDLKKMEADGHAHMASIAKRQQRPAGNPAVVAQRPVLRRP